jgi:hypothetical protein
LIPRKIPVRENIIFRVVYSDGSKDQVLVEPRGEEYWGLPGIPMALPTPREAVAQTGNLYGYRSDIVEIRGPGERTTEEEVLEARRAAIASCVQVCKDPETLHNLYRLAAYLL